MRTVRNLKEAIYHDRWDNSVLEFIDSGMKPHTLGSFGPQGIEREIIEALSAQHSNLNA